MIKSPEGIVIMNALDNIIISIEGWQDCPEGAGLPPIDAEILASKAFEVYSTLWHYSRKGRFYCPEAKGIS